MRDPVTAAHGLPAAACIPLLAIETAGSACSAAVARDGKVTAAERREMRHGHAEALFPLIERVMQVAGLRPAQLGIVTATVGPGGFTGIRVGLAAATGIALATGARLVGVDSFAAVATAVAPPRDPRDRECAALLVALDSRRADLYVQLFALPDAQPLGTPRAVLPNDLGPFVAGAAGGGRLLIGGDAAAAAAAALASSRDWLLAHDSAPDARGVAAAVFRRLRAGLPLAPARPLYLRAPDVTVPQPLIPSPDPAR